MGRPPKTPAETILRQEIARRIEFARESVGLSKSEVADAVGVSRATFTGWISGAFSPSRANLSKLCRVTGQTASFFDADEETNATDRQSFRRELYRIAGAETALALLELEPEQLLERLSEAKSTSTNAPPAWVELRAALTDSQLEDVVAGILIANRIGIADAVVESVFSLAANVAKAQSITPGSYRNRARKLVAKS